MKKRYLISVIVCAALGAPSMATANEAVPAYTTFAAASQPVKSSRTIVRTALPKMLGTTQSQRSVAAQTQAYNMAAKPARRIVRRPVYEPKTMPNLFVDQSTTKMRVHYDPKSNASRATLIQPVY